MKKNSNQTYSKWLDCRVLVSGQEYLRWKLVQSVIWPHLLILELPPFTSARATFFTSYCAIFYSYMPLSLVCRIEELWLLSMICHSSSSFLSLRSFSSVHFSFHIIFPWHTIFITCRCWFQQLSWCWLVGWKREQDCLK